MMEFYRQRKKQLNGGEEMLTVATVLVFCILLGIAFHADCELGRLRGDINQLTQYKKM
ncbi:hypothetical protein BACERE00183_04080 [Bacillus cereus]|nr:hypothetical protein BACERE00183_04080 [Bacillus cereus]